MTKIFLIGDSISIGYTPYLKEYLGKNFVFDRKTGNEEFLIDDSLVRKDENGGNSKMVLEFLNLAKGQIQTNILLLNCGLHDIIVSPQTNKNDIAISEYENNLKEIIKVGRSITPNMIWITTTPIDQMIHNSLSINKERYEVDQIKYNNLAIQVMEQFHIPIIDLNKLMMNFKISDCLEDHVHFKDEYKMIQAAYISGWLEAFSRGKNL